MQPSASQASRRGVRIVLALVVAAATGFVAYYTREVAIVTDLVAAIFRHTPARVVDVEQALGALQAVAGATLVICGVLGHRWGRRSYVAWLLTLLSVVAADVVRGATFDSILAAIAYGAGATLAVGAGWRLTRHRVAAA